VLFEVGEEHGQHAGLGLLPGHVRQFAGSDLKVPQTGWNQILPTRKTVLLEGLLPNDYAYFNHGYYCDATPDDTLAQTDYGIHYASVIGRGRLYGVQFHPEKSQRVGMTILRNFVERG
jgi:glutamine amidotransferase